MVQSFEVFLGLPEDLVARLDTLKGQGRTIVAIIVTDVAAKYVIIHSI